MRLVALALIVGHCLGTSFGQSENEGSIAGVLTDRTDAGLAAVTVELQDLNTSASYYAITDPNGYPSVSQPCRHDVA